MMPNIINLLIVIMLVVSCKSEPIEQKPTEEVKETYTPEEKAALRDIVLGNFDPSEHPDFVLIEDSHASRSGMYLQREVYESFKKMSADAAKEGIKMTIRSATRNFNYQKGIWERKWTGTTTLSDGTKATDITDPKKRALKILLYSSMPGTSRHHWGTDLDINAFNNSYFESGVGLKLYNWMLANAHDYGFCQPYTDKKSGRTGYEEEKWHWSYFPLSAELTAFSEEYIKDDMIQGFKGAETAKDIKVVSNYILGISEACPTE